MTGDTPCPAADHCDNLDGPAVGDAQIATQQGDVSPVRKWVKAEDEKEIREAYAETRAVRKLNAEAQKLADRYF